MFAFYQVTIKIKRQVILNHMNFVRKILITSSFLIAAMIISYAQPQTKISLQKEVELGGVKQWITNM
jgi:hypothetical protein